MSGTSAWAPLRHSTFRALWFALVGANVGTWMQTVGAQWLLIGHSAALVALVQTATLAPMLLLSPVAGVLADTLDRRRLLYGVTAAIGLVMVALSVVTATSTIAPATLLAFTFLLGCGQALTAPAWQAVQPELVPRAEIPAAAALGGVAINAARAVGPALAGFVVGATSPAVLFGLVALTFLAVAWTAFRWDHGPAAVREPEPMGHALRSGFRYLRAAPAIRRIVLRAALFAFPGSALWALLPIVAHERLALGADGYGVLLGLLGVGAIGGASLMPRLRRRLSANALLALSAVVFALGTLGAGYLPLAATMALLLVAGTAWIGTLASINAALQLTLPSWVRARGMGWYILVFMGAQAVGAFVWGVLADRLGYAQTLSIAAFLLLAVAVSVRWLPLLESTGQLDRTPVADWPVPAVVFDVEPTDGPVLVSCRYRVPAENAADFVTATRALERSRRRTGAREWHLYRDAADAHVFVELFVVPSWAEHLRQHHERWTGADRDVRRAVHDLSDGSEPVVEHFLPPSLDRAADLPIT